MPVAPGGYAWWYIDAISDDGQHGLTIIAFVGSVFSTWYAASGRMRPENHVCMNVALYTPGGNRWAMTERGADSLTRVPEAISIGPSMMMWDGEDLIIQFAETCAPIPRKIRGTVRVTPEALAMQCFALDAEGKHRWTPISPRARVEVKLDEPGMRWSGTGYVDSNAGDAPLEDGFSNWNWSRAHGTTHTSVFYEGERRDGSRFDLALKFDASGHAEQVAPPPIANMPKTSWRVPRLTRADSEGSVTIKRSWENAPFYSRTALEMDVFDERVEAVHESLSLDRLRSPVVRFMVPFRNPRAFF
jgi:carotenoid 1,2-hydratase